MNDTPLPHSVFLQKAIDLAIKNVSSGSGGPFGAIVVHGGKIIASAVNQVTKNHDPTAHAEIQAIRAACHTMQHFQLTGCVLYTSCEPCPMCLSAIYWARIDAVYFASNRHDAAIAGFDDERIYEELSLPPQQRSLPCTALSMPTASEPFLAWKAQQVKILY